MGAGGGAPAGRGGCGKRWRGVLGQLFATGQVILDLWSESRILDSASAAGGKWCTDFDDGSRFSRRPRISKRYTISTRQRRGSAAAKYAKSHGITPLG